MVSHYDPLWKHFVLQQHKNLFSKQSFATLTDDTKVSSKTKWTPSVKKTNEFLVGLRKNRLSEWFISNELT